MNGQLVGGQRGLDVFIKGALFKTPGAILGYQKMADFAVIERWGKGREVADSVGKRKIRAGLVVWGFTAGVISGLLSALEWDEPWDTSNVVPLADA